MPRTKSNKGKPWSETEVERLQQLVRANYGLRQIAAQLGRTEDGVVLKAQRLGLLVSRARR